ncbi:MAG: FHA domain-containing protein [Planctomycetes bacterium]|nr:FHA domain-containing protein [Planctomycetota bacterium]
MTMDWKGYQACCPRHARDPQAKVCPECGQVLLRCRGFAECGTLLSPIDACPVHVAPSLYLREGALLAARVGDCVSLPLVLRNTSRAGPALRVRRMFKVERGQEPEELALLWDTVRAGEERTFSVDTGTLAAGGSSRVGLLVVFACEFGGIEEEYAFATEILLRVNREESKQIIQNIHVEGGHFETGASAVTQTGPSMHEGWKKDEGGSVASELQLPIQRAEAFELREGIRGYTESGARVYRTVEVAFEGFPESDAPPPGSPFVAQDRLTCGRNSRRGHEENPNPNDLVLRVYDRKGELDRDLSSRVSGRHFDLFLRNDRLCLKSLGRAGTRVNDEALATGEEAILASGDRIRILAPSPREIEMTLSMFSREGVVERIALARRGI